jgi:nucleotide-binding universal stress UspA family protein
MDTKGEATDVVVAIDGTDSALAAVEWGAREAQALGCGLRLVHVIGWPFSAAAGGASSTARDEAAEISAQLLAEAAAHAAGAVSGIAAQTATRWGAVGETLVAEVDKAQTLVMGRRSRGGFAGALLGSLGLGLAAEAGCPVVLVPPSVRGEPWRSFHPRVVVGVDGSSSCAAALDYAFAHASRHSLAVEALHATGSHASGSHSDGEDAATASAVGAMLDNAGRSFPDVRVTERRVSGRAVEALTAAAADAALLVVGCRGRSEGSASMLGSVSRGSMYLAQSAVAVV